MKAHKCLRSLLISSEQVERPDEINGRKVDKHHVCMSGTLYCFARWPAAAHIFLTISFPSVRQKRDTEQRHFLMSISAVVGQASIPTVTADTLTQ